MPDFAELHPENFDNPRFQKTLIQQQDYFVVSWTSWKAFPRMHITSKTPIDISKLKIRLSVDPLLGLCLNENNMDYSGDCVDIQHEWWSRSGQPEAPMIWKGFPKIDLL